MVTDVAASFADRQSNEDMLQDKIHIHTAKIESGGQTELTLSVVWQFTGTFKITVQIQISSTRQGMTCLVIA